MSTEINKQENNILKGYNMLLFFAGTVIMYEPSEECIFDFWTNGILKNLPVSSSNPTFVMAASQLRNCCVEENICKKTLQDDFTKLFNREYLALAPALESAYNKNSTQISGNHSAKVTDFYNSYGWKSKFKNKINDDHISIELLFLTRLIENYLVLDDNVCQIEMGNEICRFIDTHLFSWIGEWNKKVQLNSDTVDFKGIANLIVACIEDIYSIFSREPKGGYSIESLKN